MASIVSNLLAGGLGQAGEGIASVINAIRGKSPEDAAKLAQMQSDFEQLQLKYAEEFQLAKINENIQLNQTAAANIQAEAKSTTYAADARPTIIYAGVLVIIVNYAILAFFPPWWGYHPLAIPDMLWEIWCVCVTGYVFARSGDKLFGGAGGSLQLPFGIKADSKGDGK